MAEEADPESEPWIQRFMDYNARGARWGREVARRRPTRAHLAGVLRVWTGLLNVRLQAEANASTQGLADAVPGREVDRTAWRPHSGARAEIERAVLVAEGWDESFLTPADEDDFDHVGLACRHIVEGLIDHLRALAVLLETDRVRRAALVLGRVLLDGAANANHLLDPNITASQRLIRCLNYELRRLGEDYEVAQAEENSTLLEQIEARVAEIDKQASAAVKISVAWPGKTKGRGLPRLGPRDKDIVVTALNGSRSVLHTLSSAVHVQEDAGFRLGIGVGVIKDDPHAASRIVLYLTYVIVAVVQLQERIALYFGWDLSPVAAATPNLLAIWTAGAGMSDTEIRAAIRQDWGESDPNDEPVPWPPPDAPDEDAGS